jgi:hypothetical protein
VESAEDAFPQHPPTTRPNEICVLRLHETHK